MWYSRTIAGLLVALAGTLGFTLSDSDAAELASVLVQVGGIAVAWWGRYHAGGITLFGTRRRRRPS